MRRGSRSASTSPGAKRIALPGSKPARGVAPGTGAAARRPAKPAPNQDEALARLREICLALPESSEKLAWGAPTFRVRDKMFAMFVDDHHGDGRVAMWCKAPLGIQEMLVDADPERFFVPPYVGPRGWIGVHLDLEVDWGEVAGLLRDAYRMTAPRRLAALLIGE